MPAGAQIFSASGVTQIDQDFRVMQVVAKVASTSMSSSAGTFGRTIWTTTIAYTDCVFAVSNTSGSSAFVAVAGWTVSGGNTTVTVTTTGASPAFDLFAFKAGGGGAIGSGVGMEVYTSAGVLGFGSGYKPFRVLSQFYLGGDGEPVSVFTATDYTATYSGKRLACVFSRHARGFDGDGTLATGSFPVYARNFRWESGGVGRLSWSQVNTQAKDTLPWERQGSFIFIDVTNF